MINLITAKYMVMIMMRIFKKKVTCEELNEKENQLKQTIYKLKKRNRHLENRLKILTTTTMNLSPLSARFSELQYQFTEFIRKFSEGSVKQKEITKPKQIKTQVQQKTQVPNYPENDSAHLTPLEQKGLVFIGKLQDEAKSQMILVGNLTTNLYPNRMDRKIRTTVSNILRKLVDLGFIHRERRCNYWYIGLTPKGYQMIKKLLQLNPLKNLIELYEEK